MGNFLNGLSFGMLRSNPFSCCCNNFFMPSFYSFNPFMTTPIFPLMNSCSIFQPPPFNFNYNFNPISTPSFNFQPMFNTSFFKPDFNSNWNNFGNFNFSPQNSFNFFGNYGWGDVFKKSRNSGSNSPNTGGISNSVVKNLSWWKAQGYNEEKGKRLAAVAKRRADGRKSTSDCATFVKNDINEAIYGTKHYATLGNGNQCGKKSLDSDKNFKKIDVSGMHLDANDIPAGVIVTYKRYSTHPAGHVEIASGNGKGYSDFTSRKLFQNYGQRREPMEIYIPV